MSERVKFEIQIESPKSERGWRALGGRDGLFYLTENSRIETLTKTVEAARAAIKRVQAHYKREWIKPAEMRIVKITVTTTYEIVE